MQYIGFENENFRSFSKLGSGSDISKKAKSISRFTYNTWFTTDSGNNNTTQISKIGDFFYVLFSNTEKFCSLSDHLYFFGFHNVDHFKFISKWVLAKRHMSSAYS